ncbi:alpha-acetolactate decarboxylase [Ilyonectria destructans]|nr:alpha-acetolactate decarboxylase [Ilyonectria destructans]
MAPNELYQYSIVSALLDGVASDGLPISTLLFHGDHGFGTFRHMVGEMIVIDREAYQMKSDGSINAIDATTSPDIIAPFAMVTHFRPMGLTKGVISSKQDLSRLLRELTPGAHNLYIAFRVRRGADRTLGGHVLALETEEEVEVEVAPILGVHLDLPRDNIEFNEAALELDGNAITTVEG